MITCPSTQAKEAARNPLTVCWQAATHALTNPTQHAWLTRPYALTDGLRSLGQLQLQVLRQTTVRPALDEQQAMGLNAGSGAHAREVCMSIDGVICVVARSVLTPTGLSGAWQTVRRLGKRPLADLLYNDRRVWRSHFEMARLNRFHPLGVMAHRLVTNGAQAHQAHWARRSVFWRDGQALLVAECFLPAFWILTQSASAASEVNG